MLKDSKEQKVLLACLAVMVLTTGYLALRWWFLPSTSGWEWETSFEPSSHSPAPDLPSLEEETLIYVHVAGQVQSPGVYRLPDDSRVVHAVEAAGGFTPEASKDGVNLAMGLGDGQRIYIPARDEVGASPLEGMVNINQAGPGELESLPGIGPALAQEIINYRSRHGGFPTVDDLIHVSGIGERTVERLRELVIVN